MVGWHRRLAGRCPSIERGNTHDYVPRIGVCNGAARLTYRNHEVPNVRGPIDPKTIQMD